MKPTDEKLTLSDDEASPDRLTTIEETLRDLLALHAAERTGAVARTHGWPEPTASQCTSVTGLLVRAATALVVGMRDPRALPPSRGELDQVLEGLALGALERVMGLPTPDALH